METVMFWGIEDPLFFALREVFQQKAGAPISMENIADPASLMSRMRHHGSSKVALVIGPTALDPLAVLDHLREFKAKISLILVLPSQRLLSAKPALASWASVNRCIHLVDADGRSPQNLMDALCGMIATALEQQKTDVTPQVATVAIAGASGGAELDPQKPIACPQEPRIATDHPAHRASGELLSLVSHDIRAPLAVIMGAVNEFSSDEVGRINDDQVFLLMLIRRSVERLTRLAANVLYIARMEAGRVEVVPREVELRGLLQHLLEEMKKLGEVGKVNVKLQLPEEHIYAHADAERIEQALANILTNAVRFARHEVDIRLFKDSTHVCIEIADDGPGVPEEALDYLFAPVGSPLPAQHTKKLPKKGLGLPIAWAILQAHGGWLRAANRYGPTKPGNQPTGSCFILGLPRSTVH